jgi:hypothetical protein
MLMFFKLMKLIYIISNMYGDYKKNNGLKSTGGPGMGINKTTGSTTNSTYGRQPSYGNQNNYEMSSGIKNVKKFDDKDVNEAKEHLKLLKAKLGNTGLKTTTTSNISTTNNYRKPFQPNFEEYEEPKITKNPTSYVMNNNTKQTAFTSSTIKKPVTSNTNTLKTSTINKNTKPMNTNMNKNNFKQQQYDEYVDDRPAVAGKKIEYIIFIYF